MSKTADCVIGLGANLGARDKCLRETVEAVAAWVRVSKVSWLYETVAMGPPQPDYLNAAIRVECARPLPELLEILLGIERAAGRVRVERWGPRTLDLDVLWVRGVALVTRQLQVPHPRLCERAFAVLPLLDVAEDAADPRTGLVYASLRSGLDVSGVRRVAGPEWAAQSGQS